MRRLSLDGQLLERLLVDLGQLIIRAEVATINELAQRLVEADHAIVLGHAQLEAEASGIMVRIILHTKGPR